MKRFLSFFVCFFMLSSLFIVTTHATSNIHLNSNESRYISNVPFIISGDVYINNNKCHDDNENTFSVIVVSQASTVRAPWGCDVIYDQTETQVVQASNNNHSRDNSCTVWPRGSSGNGNNTTEETWQSYRWRQLQSNQYLLVQSGVVYWNFTSQSNQNSINITKNTTISTTQIVWIKVTSNNARLYNYDPGYEEIQLSPSSSQPQQDEGEWIYKTIPPMGYSTGWIWAFTDGVWLDLKQSCNNGLVVKNNSNHSTRIKCKKANPNDARDKKIVTVYSSGNDVNLIKRVYARTIGVPEGDLSYREIFLNTNTTNPKSPLVPN
jgi:hypothetical protein